MNPKKLIIYLPALNEEKDIIEVIKSLPKKISGVAEVEILVIDDGSTDRTRELCLKEKVSVVSHVVNRGVGLAFQTAVNYALEAEADILVSIDADGQFDANQIKDLVLPILERKADFCTGNRFKHGKPENMPYIKFWGNSQISRLVSFISGVRIYDASCGFRAYSRESLYSLNVQGSFTYTHETILELLQKGFHINQVAIKVKYYQNRVSRIANNLWTYAFRTSLIIFKTWKDYKPLRFFLSIAGVVIILALLIGGFVLVHWLQTGMITPYKSFGFIALSLCGIAVILTTLAFVADMLTRIRMNQERILYLTKKNYFEKN
ncbi:glycosyltransferase family 2 protein [Salinimicrobium terrae]|uniref:glycosyltransferase family 2 protein n=1 Tax=Salinimicrobium terrae TaxID=470866 RepID=UPI0003F51DAF|nr:glycosyltransferase family 2 protein [Salinimicrobium terrae]